MRRRQPRPSRWNRIQRPNSRPFAARARVLQTDFQELNDRPDLDAVLIATPDHWHEIVAIDAMKKGKDIYCEKPETLTIHQGQRMLRTARRYGRVLSGGSQRVWGDYNWFHRLVRGGVLGDVKEAWANVWGPSGPCYLEPHDVPADVDWKRPLPPFRRQRSF